MSFELIFQSSSFTLGTVVGSLASPASEATQTPAAPPVSGEELPG